MLSAEGAFDVLIVSSWFPAYDDPAAGRFVADQAEALAATGVARIAVITFDAVRLSGGATSRGRQASVVLKSARAAAADGQPLFQAPSWAVDPALAVARLTIPDGLTAAAGPTHAAAHRQAVLLALARRLAGEGATGRRGVVHAHTVYPDGVAAVGLAEALGWPLLLTEHSSFVEKFVAVPVVRAAYTAALGRAHRTLAVSEMLAGELRAAFPDHAAKIAVLPNAVPMDLFSPVSRERRVRDELLFVGYRKPTKGIENLLRAVAIARAIRPTITLTLLGSSPDEATEAGWHALASELGLTDAVSFQETTDRAGIADAMTRASLFVHPSPRETFGVVAVEALASGLPVVATDSGGVSEVLEPNLDRVGAIVPVGNPELLGRAIVATLDRRLDLDPHGLRASVERRFGSAFVAERLLLQYRDALAGVTGGSDGASFGRGKPASDPPPTTIVVALDRGRAADRLAKLPVALRETLLVVTATKPDSILLPSVGSLVEVDIDTPWRPDLAAPRGSRRPGLAGSFARLVNDPAGALRRRVLGRDAGWTRSLAPAAIVVESVARDLARKAPVEIVALDGHDYVAAVGAVRGGHASMVGGPRRLADTWLSSGLGTLDTTPLADPSRRAT